MTPTPARFVNRGFVATLIVLMLSAEALLRALASAPAPVVRMVYGTTLSMYMAVAGRLREQAPEIRVLAMGDSLSLTQWQPQIYARAAGLPERAVFNASYLALTFKSQEQMLRRISIERLSQLQRVILFVNPRRLTTDGNVDADVFRVAIPDADGPWQEAWRQRRVAPLLDYSRLYGLSRYLVTAAWRQIGEGPRWDQVEFLGPHGGIAFDAVGLPSSFPYAPIGAPENVYVDDLRRVIALCRDRGVAVIMSTSAVHRDAVQFASAADERAFADRMAHLAREMGAEWRPIPKEWRPASDTDFLDYGHLNRRGGEEFTRFFADHVR